MRVVGVHGGSERLPSGCELYRINIPLSYLSQKGGWEIDWIYMRTLFAEWYVSGAQAVHNFFSGYDVIILARVTVDSEMPQDMTNDLFDFARAYGVKMVYEVDDDFTNIHRKVSESDMLPVASRCDAITVTTPFLADLMTRHTGRPAFVLPNMLDPRLWHDGEIRHNLKEGEVVIWLSGSPSHKRDWMVLKDIFPPLLQKHPHAKLLICGFYPEYLQNIEGAFYIKPMRYDQYAQTVRQVDIVLAPVDPDDGFNDGKSPVKTTEGQGAVRKIQNRFCGAAVIATDNPVYRLSVSDGYDGMLVPYEPQAWYDALDKLLTDKAERQRLQANAYRTVWHKGTWDISKQWTQWAKAYQQIKAMPNQQVSSLAKIGEGVIS